MFKGKIIMKIRLKKKSLQLRTLLALALQITSAEAGDYDALLFDLRSRNMRETESPPSMETPFSWSHCFDCFYWHDEEEVEIPLTQQKAKKPWDREYFTIERPAYLPPYPGGYHW